MQLTLTFFNQTKRTALKFEGFEKKIKQFVMVTFFSSAQSVHLNQYFCLMCIYQLFLILDHTKSYVEKNTLKIRSHQCGAQVVCKDQAGCLRA